MRKMRRIGDGWELPLQAPRLAQCAAISFLFEAHGVQAFPRVKGDLQLVAGEGVSELVVARPAELAPVISLVNEDVSSGYVTESGTLELAF